MPNDSAVTATSDIRTRPLLHDVRSLAVWGVWLLCSLALIAQVSLYGVNVPKWDDWVDIIPVFDGQRPLDLAYLWEPNFGHRLTLPRLVQIGLLHLTNGDFRAGKYFNAACMIASSLLVLLALRSTREDRRSRLSDLVVPLVLLSWVHFETVLWSYQVQYTLSTLFVCVVLSLFLVKRDFLRGWPLAALGVSLLLLPLCGFNGLVFVPLTALWLVVAGIRHRRAGLPAVLTGAAALALTLACMIHLGKSSMAQFDPKASAETVMMFLRFGFGSAGLPSVGDASLRARFTDFLPLIIVAVMLLWQWSRRRQYLKPRAVAGTVAAAVLILAGAAAMHRLRDLATLVLPVTTLYLYAVAFLALVRNWRRGGADRMQAEALLTLLVASVLLTASVGMARATGGIPARYVTLAAVPLLIVYAILAVARCRDDERTAGVGGGIAVPVLAALIVLLAPINYNRARAALPEWAGRQRAVLAAIHPGMPISRVAALPFDITTEGPEVLLKGIPRLKAAGVAPYATLSDDPPPQDLMRFDPARAVCDGVERQKGNVFVATRAGGTITVPLPRPCAAPLVRLRYEYLDVKRGEPTASVAFRPSGGGSLVTPVNGTLRYSEWTFSGKGDVLTSSDETIDALVIALPEGAPPLRLDEVTVWR